MVGEGMSEETAEAHFAVSASTIGVSLVLGCRGARRPIEWIAVIDGFEES